MDLPGWLGRGDPLTRGHQLSKGWGSYPGIALTTLFQLELIFNSLPDSEAFAHPFIKYTSNSPSVIPNQQHPHLGSHTFRNITATWMPCSKHRLLGPIPRLYDSVGLE